MTDRNVQYPNRYQLTLVSGETDIYDLTAVPGTVTAAGTALNKANTMTDATETALFGDASDRTINQALNATRYTRIVEITTDTTLSTSHCFTTLNVTAEADLTIPDGTAIPVGEEIEIIRRTSDTVRIIGSSSVYVELVGATAAVALDANPISLIKYGPVVLKHIAAGYWSVVGI